MQVDDVRGLHGTAVSLTEPKMTSLVCQEGIVIEEEKGLMSKCAVVEGEVALMVVVAMGRECWEAALECEGRREVGDDGAL